MAMGGILLQGGQQSKWCRPGFLWTSRHGARTRGLFDLNAPGFVNDAHRTGWAMPLPNPDGRVPTLYVDGHIDLMPWEELKERRPEIIGTKSFNAPW